MFLKQELLLLRDLGYAMSPFNAFQFIQGLETLSLRIERQSKNAEKIACFLKINNKISKVIYPSLYKQNNSTDK